MTQEEFENKLMNMLLQGNEEILAILRKQYESAKIVSRDFSGAGFFVEYLVDDSLKLHKILSTEIGDIRIDYKDVQNAFGEVLFIRNGLISMLECYTLAVNDWKTDYENFKLYYINNKRDLL